MSGIQLKTLYRKRIKKRTLTLVEKIFDNIFQDMFKFLCS